MTHQFPDSVQYHRLFRLVLLDFLALLSELLRHCTTCAVSRTFSILSTSIFDWFVTLATSRRMFPGPQLPNALLPPRVMCSNFQYWFCRWASSALTSWKGVSGSSKLDRSISFQGCYLLGPASWRGCEVVALLVFGTGADGALVENMVLHLN